MWGWVEAAPRRASLAAVVLRKGISPLCAYLTSELMLVRGEIATSHGSGKVTGV